jgi:hypothetical protein
MLEINSDLILRILLYVVEIQGCLVDAINVSD